MMKASLRKKLLRSADRAAAAGMLAAFAAGLAAQPFVLAPEAGEEQPGWRAQVTAASQAQLSSRMTGALTQILRDGESFRKGDVIAEYDCAFEKARLARALAAESGAAGKFRAAHDLRKLSSVSEADYEEARAALEAARAESKAEKVLAGRCRVEAPFNGRVGESFVRRLEYVQEGQKLMTIYGDDAFELESILPSRLIPVLRPGTKLALKIDETGERCVAEIVRIAGTVDPVSQSVKISARILSSEAAPGTERQPILPGMSGTITLLEKAR